MGSEKTVDTGSTARTGVGDHRGPAAEPDASTGPAPDAGADGRRVVPVTTMRDIAAAAGVSQSTVSRVLNDVSTRVPIAAETRERVVLTARRLRYRPNPLARGLRGAPTMLLGAVVRDFSDPFFAGAIETLAVEAMGSGYNVVLGHAHGRLEEAISLPAVIETRHCDAIVLLGDMQDQPRLLEDLRNSTVPIVALWQGSSPLEFPTVDVDNHAGIFAGLQHLIGLGHERIAFVSGQLPGDNPQRIDAFVEFMTARFGIVPDGYIQHVPNSMAGGEAALAALLELGEPPTALVTSTDLVAVGVLHAAYSRNCVVPDELSVVGYDDLPIVAHTVPALTTLRMPIPEVTGEGVRLAIQFARDASLKQEAHRTLFEPTLVVRQSTAPPMTSSPTATRRVSTPVA